MATPTAPLEVVTLEEAKAWAKVDYSVDDAIIEELITTAVDLAQKFTGRQLFSIQVNGVDMPAYYSETPAAIKTAIKNYVASYYENRNNPAAPDGFSQFKSTLSPFREVPWI